MNSKLLPELPPIRIDMIKIHGRDVGLLRLDEIDPIISGNKWFKLKYNIEQASKKGMKGLLTFGGAFSNHIAAVAAAGKLCGLRTVGIIRGEPEYSQNPTLSRAEQDGMELQFLSRSEFREKQDPAWLLYWNEKHPELLYVPEGGSNNSGVKGASEIVDNFDDRFDSVSLALGTGGTIAGILKREKIRTIHGYPVLKLRGQTERIISELTGGNHNNLVIHDNFHFGGYAKYSTELLKFIRDFYQDFGIKLDPVYTGKLMYGVVENIKNGMLSGRPLIIHTGGLQGVLGFEELIGERLF